EAEFVRVPLADMCLIILGETLTNIEDKDLVLLSDIFPTGLASSLEIPLPSLGAGPVRLLAAYSAIIRGASRVYSVDSVEERLAVAPSIGVIPINFTTGEPAAHILVLEPDDVQRTGDCVGLEAVK
ncbi:hypothetical protein V1523DRAFT_350235, partial [Lipomyces doorenjongii]